LNNITSWPNQREEKLTWLRFCDATRVCTYTFKLSSVYCLDSTGLGEQSKQAANAQNGRKRSERNVGNAPVTSNLFHTTSRTFSTWTLQFIVNFSALSMQTKILLANYFFIEAVSTFLYTVATML
jgi:hypothetical protein